MRKLSYILLAFAVTASSGCSILPFGKKKKAAEPAEQLTPYEKFFKDNKVSTSRGWITTHMAKDKCFVEFPLNLLDTDMVYISSIENISDNREGAVGQFSDDGLIVFFTLQDSTLRAHMRFGMPVENQTGDRSIDEAISNSSLSGVFKSCKVEAWTPDSTAVVVDMTKFFVEHNEYASPFPAVSASTMLGFKSRQHKLIDAESYPLRSACYGQTLMVTCKLKYTVDIYTMGRMSEKDVPVSIEANKMLRPLPPEVMRARLADSRIGAAVDYGRRISGDMKIETTHRVKRWRVEPSDPEAYARGETVRPRKPIVFYIDSLMPVNWRPYVEAGVKEWNKAFEQIGFQEVIEVRDYPVDDPGFNANDIAHSKIIYAPLWSYNPETSTLCDPRSGEILNAAILLPSNFSSTLQRSRIIATVGADPSVRRGQFSDEQIGRLIKSSVMQYTGMALGLVPNMTASAAYPVDSLRSPSFTRKWGITSSVMDNIPYNFVAQPEDVAAGVLMEPETIGPYDYYAIGWMYRPVPGAATPVDELAVLDGWINEKAGDPVYRYYVMQYPQVAFDPTAVSGDLGDDPIRAAELARENFRRLAGNFYEWFDGQDDKDVTYREALFAYVAFGYQGKLNNVINLIGGIYRNDIKNGDPRPAYEVVPRHTQKRAVKFVLDASRDIEWANNVGNRTKMGVSSGTSMNRSGLLGSLLSRAGRLAVCVEKDADAYSPEELVEDIYTEVWGKTRRGLSLDTDDMKMQLDMLGAIVATAGLSQQPASQGQPGARPAAITFDMTGAGTFAECLPEQAILAAAYSGGDVMGFEPSRELAKVDRGPVASLYYDMLLRTRDLIRSRVAGSTGDTRAHYEFMLFKIKQVLEKP